MGGGPGKKTVVVYAPGRQPQKLRVTDQVGGEDVLPGFALAVSEIFR